MSSTRFVRLAVGILAMILIAETAWIAYPAVRNLIVPPRENAAQRGRTQVVVRSLLATLGLGLCFLGVKAVEYGDHFAEGIYPGAYYRFEELPGAGPRAFFTLYFFMTVLHAAHASRSRGTTVPHSSQDSIFGRRSSNQYARKPGQPSRNTKAHQIPVAGRQNFRCFRYVHHASAAETSGTTTSGSQPISSARAMAA